MCFNMRCAVCVFACLLSFLLCCVVLRCVAVVRCVRCDSNCVLSCCVVLCVRSFVCLAVCFFVGALVWSLARAYAWVLVCIFAVFCVVLVVCAFFLCAIDHLIARVVVGCCARLAVCSVCVRLFVLVSV